MDVLLVRSCSTGNDKMRVDEEEKRVRLNTKLMWPKKGEMRKLLLNTSRETRKSP